MSASLANPRGLHDVPIIAMISDWSDAACCDMFSGGGKSGTGLWRAPSRRSTGKGNGPGRRGNPRLPSASNGKGGPASRWTCAPGGPLQCDCPRLKGDGGRLPVYHRLDRTFSSIMLAPSSVLPRRLPRAPSLT